ncbi:MAG: hypothetical protein SPL42_00145 [Bacteroidales bacterium]|nr:hypothetical protein [Bacteroidales bacterium]
MRLIDIKNRQIGIIVLNNELTLDEVTEIFIRINSQGTKLNQADFAMSRMAANEKYDGNSLRKAIEYFSHLAATPEWYSDMLKDTEFANTVYAGRLSWLKNDRGSIYDPDFNDIIRVSFMYKFGRAKMKDLVALLEGRNFETKENEEAISENTFSKMSEGVLNYMNQYTFSNFTYLDPQINKAIGEDSPNVYFSNAFDACKEGLAKYGNISSIQDLKANLATNAIPLSITEMDSARYDEFLSFRRVQMAQKIKQYYDSL